MQAKKHPIDYKTEIVTVIEELPPERAAQLYNFARFLLEETRWADQAPAIEYPEMEDSLSDAELADEDALWEANMSRHTEKFAMLKAQAKTEVKAQKTSPMFKENGEFNLE